MEKVKNKINVAHWETKLIVAALIFLFLIICFIRTYERYVVPAAGRQPDTFFVNDIEKGYTRLYLSKGSVSQTIRGDYNGLSQAAVRIGVSKEDKKHRKDKKDKAAEDAEVLMRIRDMEDLKVIQERKIPVSEMENNTFQQILLEKELIGISDQLYKIEISLSGKADVFLWTSGKDNYPRGECFQNNKKVSGDLSFSLTGSGYGFLKGVYYVVGILSVLGVMMLILYLFFWKNFRAEHIFLAGSLFFGIVYSIVLPPFASPDESAHFITSYNLSSSILGKEPVVEEKILTQDPYQNDGFFNRYTDLNTYRNLYNSLQDSSLSFYSFYDVQYDYGSGRLLFEGHLVHAVTIAVGRLLSLGYMPLVYLTRFLNMVFYCAVTYFAIKIMPVGKLFMLGVSLLPMVLEQTASVSYDGWVISFAFLYIACCLHCIFEKERVTLKDMLCLLFLLFLCSNFKYIYYLMGGMLFLIPRQKLSNRKQIYILFGIVAALFLVMSGKIAVERSQPKTEESLKQSEENVVGSNRGKTYLMSDLIRQPKMMIDIYINTIRDKSGDYLEEMIGQSLGSLNVSVHRIYIYILFLLLFLMAVKDRRDTYCVSRSQGIVFVSVFLGIAAAAMLSMLVAWTNIASDSIIGVQGRYFLPVLPLFGLLVHRMPIKLEKDISRKLICLIYIVDYLVILDAFEYCIQ